MQFNFSEKWADLGPNTQKAFIEIVKRIEIYALEQISVKYHIDYSKIENEVTHLDPHAEWKDIDPERGLPEDWNWIDFEVQFFEEELREKGIL
jgi:hypothetical protein